jgi:hypothetical protein
MKRKFSFNLAPVVSTRSALHQDSPMADNRAEDSWQGRTQSDTRAYAGPREVAGTRKVAITAVVGTITVTLAPQQAFVQRQHHRLVALH